MSDDWHTLRVPPEAYEQAKAQKEANGRTWGEQVVRPDGDETDLETEIRRLREQVERVPEDTAEALGEQFA